MGGSKFQLGRVRKYADQQKRKPVTLMVSIPRSHVSVQASTGLYMSPCVCPQLSLSLCSEEQPADDPHLTVSLPLSTFVNSHVRSLQQLTSRVSTLTVSLPWVITSHLPLILCRIEVSSDQQPILEVSLTIDATLQWTATVLHKILNPTTSIPLFHLPHSIKAAEDVHCLLRFFSDVKVCVGNPDAGLIEQWKKRSCSLHYSCGKGLLHWLFISAFINETCITIGNTVAFLDTSDPHGRCTIRHNKCHIVLSNNSRTIRCSACSAYRLKLLVQRSRPPQSSERKNYRYIFMYLQSTRCMHKCFRYQSVPELLHTLDKLKHRNRILTKYASRLKMKIEKAVEPELVCLDDEVNGYIKDTTESPQYLSNIAALPGSSFQRIFWMQQVEAAKKKKRGVRWHPLMIRWCLYLRHR